MPEVKVFNLQLKTALLEASEPGIIEGEGNSDESGLGD